MLNRIIITATLIFGGVVVATAESPAKLMDGMDFMIQAPQIGGQRVRLEGYRVDGLSFQGGFLRLPGGAAALEGPWLDREDFRRLIPGCEQQWFESAEAEKLCFVTVEATVGEKMSGEYPVLKDVDFIFE